MGQKLRFWRALGRLLLLIGLTSNLWHVAPVWAAGVVGNGAPESCTGNALAAAVAGAGAITFNCGPNPHTIQIDTLVIPNGVAVTLDGGGLITLNGAGLRQLFMVEANASLTLNRLTLANGSAAGNGGAITSQGSLTINESTLQNNHAVGLQGLGGALAILAGRVIIHQSLFANNQGDGSGGALYLASGASGEIYRSRLINNHTLPTDGAHNFMGGAIYNSGHLLIEESTLTGNTATDAGAIFTGGEGSQFTLRRSLLSGNRVTGGGGAIIFFPGVSLIENSTISGNSALIGGGLRSGVTAGTGTVQLHYVTLYGNQATTNGANLYVDVGSQPVSVQGTVFAAPQGTANCFVGTALRSDGYNFASDPSCGLATATDQQGGDPLLGALADNGGATFTHLPQAGSPLLDSGPATDCPALDQRGLARPQGNRCDMGAVETGTNPTPQPTPTLPPIIHAEIENGVKATIAVNPNHGYSGQQITISGQAPAGYTQVRITSARNGQTVGVHLATVAADGGYQVAFIIPPDVVAGTLDLCAILVGAANAALACTPLQIDPMPTVPVSGELPDGAATVGQARLMLYAANGGVAYTAPIGENGAFQLAKVQAGQYKYAVTGEVSKPIANGVVEILPTAAEAKLHLIVGDDGTMCVNFGHISASPARDENAEPFGAYISGVTNEVTFEAFPQTKGPVQKVRFEMVSKNSQTIDSQEVTGPPWIWKFDVGRLPPSYQNIHSKVFATPVVNGKNTCSIVSTVQVVANPFPKGKFQPDAIVWDRTARLYRIQATIPYIPGILPGEFSFDVPLLGQQDNRLNTGIQVVGTLNLDGFAHLTAVNAILDAKLMNQQVFNNGVTLFEPNAYLPLDSIPQVDYPLGPYTFINYYAPTPFLSVPVVSFFGLLDVTVNGSAGIGGAISIEGHLQPLRPGLTATLRADGKAHGELGLGLRLLQGLAEAGATSRVDGDLGIPLTVEVLPDQHAKLDACLSLQFSIHAFASVLWKVGEWDETKPLTQFPKEGDPGCIPIIDSAVRAAASVPSEPALVNAPAIAIGADGTQLSAYVENTTTAGTPPRVQVLARFKTPEATSWSEPMALTDPTHSVSSPVVAFVGPTHMPLVAWVENMLTAPEADALGQDLNAILRHQEIAYSTWDGTAWHAPTYLTNDLLGDGLPALAGSTAGAVLAWTRDLDGNAATRSDQQIAVATFDPVSQQFGAIDLLTAPGGGLNGDVQAAYDESSTPPKAYLVWVHDSDASLVTADDRTLTVAFRDNLSWTQLNPQGLPARVDSPTISAGADGVHLAFLVREASADGSVGLVGTNGMLWTALLRNGAWQAQALPGEHEQPVYAERPQLATQGNEALLLFRRFEQQNDNSRLGQIALSQTRGQAHFAQPLYLTDEPRENWLPAMALDPRNGAATILKIARTSAVDAASLTTIGASHALVAVQSTPLSSKDAPIDALNVAATADPALDPLTVNTSSAAPGQSVMITVTVRNVGCHVAEGVTVSLYTGEPGSGVLVATAAAPNALGFNERFVAPMQLTVTGGEQPIYARLTTSGQNETTTNDQASFVLGRLMAPTLANVIESSEYTTALTINWLMAPNVYARGYRILRSNNAEGPFEVVDEASVTTFNDTLIERGKTYCYAVQAYNTNTLSAQSSVVCSAPPLPLAGVEEKIYLPLVRR